jgi:hypothetical protein
LPHFRDLRKLAQNRVLGLGKEIDMDLPRVLYNPPTWETVIYVDEPPPERPPARSYTREDGETVVIDNNGVHWTVQEILDQAG